MDRPPNIIVVLSDQQRPDSCGFYGQRLPVTPNLDRLAADGVVFDNAFTVQPVCGPARASIQTGLMPTSIGCWRNGLALPDGVETLASRLGTLGYWTGYVGKWHLASNVGFGLTKSERVDYASKPVPPHRRGGYRDGWVAADVVERTSRPYGGHLFDESGNRVEINGYRVDGVTDLAIDQLARRADDRPFLQFISFLEPHHQNSKMRSVGPRGQAQRFAHHDVPGDLAGSLGDWRWNYPEYLACCASIDHNVGRLITYLKATDEIDRTTVVYASDHGSHFRTRNLEYKRSCHDASIRIPLLINGPGFRGGRHCDRLVTHLDLLPTLVEAAGGDLPKSNGRPLQEALAGGVWRDAVLVQISESQIGRCLRTDQYTYSVRAHGGGPLAGHRHPGADRYTEDKLYDLATDPHQRRNLIDHPSTRNTRAALAGRLVSEIERVEGTRPYIESR